MTYELPALLRDIAQEIERDAPYRAEIVRLAAERIELLEERARLLLAIDSAVFQAKEIDGARQFPKPVTTTLRSFSDMVKARMAVDPAFRSALEADPE